jgi:hypothetical protein
MDAAAQQRSHFRGGKQPRMGDTRYEDVDTSKQPQLNLRHLAAALASSFDSSHRAELAKNVFISRSIRINHSLLIVGWQQGRRASPSWFETSELLIHICSPLVLNPF